MSYIDELQERLEKYESDIFYYHQLYGHDEIENYYENVYIPYSEMTDDEMSCYLKCQDYMDVRERYKDELNELERKHYG